MQKNSIYLVLIIAFVLVISGCGALIEPTGAGVTNPQDCKGNQKCLACVNKDPDCGGSQKRYAKVWEWVNGACGLTISEFCPKGCFNGHCAGKDYGAICFPTERACGDQLKGFKFECDNFKKIAFAALKPLLPLSDILACKNMPNYEFTCRKKKSPFICTHTFWESVTGSLLCKVEDITTCPKGCDDTFFPNRCKGKDSVCKEGFEVCSDGKDFITPKKDGNPYTCAQGRWLKKQDCSSVQTCQEFSPKKAVCRKPTDKFCVNNNIECIACNEGFDTLEECKKEIVVYCLSSDKTKCIKRGGSCLPGEFESKGSEPDKIKKSCEVRLCGQYDKACCPGGRCNENLVCRDKFAFQIRTCQKKIIIGPGKNKTVCDISCESKALLKFGNQIIIPNHFCIQKCKLQEFFRPILIGFSIFVAIVIFLTTLFILRSKFTRKSDQAMISIISLLFGAGFGLFIFFFFWLAVLFVIIYLAILVGFGILKKKVGL